MKTKRICESCTYESRHENEFPCARCLFNTSLNEFEQDPDKTKMTEHEKPSKAMNIKELRAASGMTQQQFSQYFNIPKRTIENWEGEIRQCPEYLLELIEYKLKNEGHISGTKFSTIEMLELRNQGMNISEIAEAIGCSKHTVWNRLKQVKSIEDMK